VITYYSKPKYNGGGLNLQKILVDYANIATVEFIVDPKVLFHGWWIYRYFGQMAAKGVCR